MEPNPWARQFLTFSEDLIETLLTRHPALCTLSNKPDKPADFPDAIVKCVLMEWQKRKNELDQNLERDFPAFAETEESFTIYLKRFVDFEKQSEHDVIRQILGMSATLYEILLFMHRNGRTPFVHYASSYLYFMLSHVNILEFYAEGGWSKLESMSEKLSEDYDEEICRQNISENVCSISTSDETEKSSIDSNLECPIEALNRKAFQPDGSVSQKSQIEIYSANEKETLTEVAEKHTQELVSILNNPDELEKEPASEETTPGEVNSQVVSPFNKPDELEKKSANEETTPGEVNSQVVSVLNKPDELEKAASEETTPGEVNSQFVSPFNKPDELEIKSASEETTPGEVNSQVVSVLNKPDELKKAASEETTPGEVNSEVVSALNKTYELEIKSASEETTPGEVNYQVVSALNKPDDELEKAATEETSGEVNSQVVSPFNKPDELEIKSANEETTPGEVNSQVVSVLNKPDELKKEASEETTPGEVNSEVVSALNKTHELEIKSASEETTPGEVNSQVVSALNKPDDELEKAATEETTPGELNSQVALALNKPDDEFEKEPVSEETTSGEVNSQVVSALNKLQNELEKNLTNEVNPHEVADKESPELLSILNKSMDETKKDSINKGVTPDEIKEHSQGAISIVNKPEDESKNDFKNKVAPKEKLSPEAVILFNEPQEKPNKNSTKTDSTLSEATKTNSPKFKQPNIQPLIKVSSDLTDIESNESKLEFIKTIELLKTDKQYPSSASVHQDVSVTEKEFQLTDSSTSTLMLTIPQINSESLREEISPIEKRKPSPDRNISGDHSMHCAVGFTKPEICSSESIESSPIDCELSNEVDKFLIEEITTHFQVRFLSEEEIEAYNWISEDNGKKNSNVHSLKQDEAIQADLVPLNSQNIPTLANLAQTAALEEKNKIPTEHVCIDQNATKKDQSLFKSPKPEIKKEATPNKAKTPSAGKVSVKDTRNKTASFNQNQNVTPLKTPTGTPKSCVSSAGGNATEEKTPKKLKCNFTSSKSSSPRFKTPTDKGVSKLQSKSCEKTERNQNLSASKASAEITESSPKFDSAANTKSRRLSDSSKSLPTVMRPKLGEKDPLNNLKSSSIVSESIPEIKVAATDIPIASEKRKFTNPKSENCQKSGPREKTAGSSSAKSTDQSESKTKSSKESLDVRSCKESSSSIKKSDQKKGNETSKAPSKSTVLSTARRTQNVQEKNTSLDPKNEKPRWR